MMSTTQNPAGTYADVRQYLDELDRRGLLVRVDRKINKDTEIMPLVRWQFRGLQTGEEFRNDRTLSSYFETGQVVPPQEESS
jgi:hypothetical protein